MECYCGCGRRVSRQLTDTNLRISEVALELLAWDKRRSTSPMEPGDFVETERLIDRGANSHRRLLAALHGELDDVSLVESDEWLAESKARWHDREEMTERGGFLRGPQAEADQGRSRPHRSRPSGAELLGLVPGAGRGSRRSRRSADPAGQLQRLRSLRAEGILTEDEFRAAEARLGD